MAGQNVSAMKARIMSHMNADHEDSLQDYLRFYNKISATPASAKLVDFDVDFMKIEYVDINGSPSSSIVKIEPPMSSLAESRTRLIAMAEEATGQPFHHQPPGSTHSTSDVAADSSLRWSPPDIVGIVTATGISFGLLAFAWSYPFSQGGPLEAILPQFLLEFCREFRPQLFAGLLTIQVAEGAFVAWKAFHHRASIGDTILWGLNGFLEGGPAIRRLNNLLGQKRSHSK